MTEKAAFQLRGRNPDVLTSIANLSNDEVFTPPELANRMLDSLHLAWSEANGGASIWEDSSVTFLDPFTKSGVFLREITNRLVDGLQNEIPDLQTRVNHVLTKQVFGIAITQLTSLLSRRSVYCSKRANGEHSICSDFADENGNIWFERTDHVWAGGTHRELRADGEGNTHEVNVDGRCKFCAAPRKIYDRGLKFETHSYAFIHSDDPRESLREKFGDQVKFDVVIGNPPYQLADGGGEGASATPLYNLFVQQAVAIEPAYVVMVIPARWYSGGKGLDSFREFMLSEPNRLVSIDDFPETEMVFPGVNIRGGVCYFVRHAFHQGEVRVTNHRLNGSKSESKREIREEGLNIFIRHNEAISILDKVRAKREETFDSRVQSRNPFGIPSNFQEFKGTETSDFNVVLYRSRRGESTDREVFIRESAIKQNFGFKDRLKVLVSKASPGGDDYPHSVLGQPFIAQFGSVCTETYLIVDFPESELAAKNLIAYMSTKFFRFLVSLVKNTQNISKASFSLVPVLPLDIAWTDELLNERYGISLEEQQFIDTLVRPFVKEAHD